ncbi:MAG: hypothetical protein JO071_06730 [Deltaproteobacteria bacterium]|nr:hypothetical protein [Deltaproteobacteria bacterium]
MVEKNISDTAQNAAASVQRAADTAQSYAAKGADVAREYADKGYDAAREYTNAGMDVAARMSDNLTEFVRNEPWIAVVAAFAIGYVAARIMRRMSI